MRFRYDYHEESQTLAVKSTGTESLIVAKGKKATNSDNDGTARVTANDRTPIIRNY